MVGIIAERPAIKLKDILAQEPIKLGDVGDMGAGSGSSLSCETGPHPCDCQCCNAGLLDDLRVGNVIGINDLVGGENLKKGDDQFGRFRTNSSGNYYREDYTPDTSKDYSDKSQTE